MSLPCSFVTSLPCSFVTDTPQFRLDWGLSVVGVAQLPKRTERAMPGTTSRSRLRGTTQVVMETRPRSPSAKADGTQAQVPSRRSSSNHRDK